MQLAIGTNLKIKKGPDRFTMAPIKTFAQAFEIPSRVNLSGPSLDIGYIKTHSIGLAGATRLARSDLRLNLLLLKGQYYLKESENGGLR